MKSRYCFQKLSVLGHPKTEEAWVGRSLVEARLSCAHMGEDRGIWVQMQMYIYIYFHEHMHTCAHIHFAHTLHFHSI